MSKNTEVPFFRPCSQGFVVFVIVL